MSIKIYDGLKAVDNDVWTAVRRARSVLEPLFIRQFHALKEHIQQGVEQGKYTRWEDLGLYLPQDKAHIQKQTVDIDLYTRILDLHRSKEYTFSPADFAYDVVALPNGLPGGNPLLMVYGQQSRTYVRALRDAGVVIDYGYWDNTDPEEGVSDQEWAQRKQAWMGSGLIDLAPMDAGLTFSVPSRVATILGGRNKTTS